MSNKLIFAFFAAFFAAAAAAMVVPLRIILLAGLLQLPLPLVGLIEGLAVLLSALVNFLPLQWVANYRVRGGVALLGYGVAALSQPLLGLTDSGTTTLGLVALEGGASRLHWHMSKMALAHSYPIEQATQTLRRYQRGAAVGAIIGPLAAALLLYLSFGVREVIVWAVLPGVLALACAVPTFFVRANATDANTGGMTTRQSGETLAPERIPVTVAAVAAAPGITVRPRRTENMRAAAPLAQELASDVQPALRDAAGLLAASRRWVGELGGRFWMFATLTALFGLGASSESFLVLKTAILEQTLAAVALAYALGKATEASLSPYLIRLSARWGRLAVLITGYGAFSLIYAGWAIAAHAWSAWLLFALFGAYSALTRGVADAFISDLVPASLRSTGRNLLALIAAIGILAGNVVAGLFWSNLGPQAMFAFAAWIGLLTLVLAVAWLPWLRRVGDAP